MNPVVTIEMENGGIIRAELYPDIAPNSVNNFLSLVKSGFYDGLIFHRVIPGFMIQGGCPKGNGMGGPGYSIKGEFASNGVDNARLHVRGALSMARSSALDSAGSQFFVCVAPAASLDGSYAVFGQVLAGLETVDAIVNTPRDASDKPYQPQQMKLVRVETYSAEYPFEQIAAQ